jgi:hypothetical protein
LSSQFEKKATWHHERPIFLEGAEGLLLKYMSFKKQVTRTRVNWQVNHQFRSRLVRTGLAQGLIYWVWFSESKPKVICLKNGSWSWILVFIYSSHGELAQFNIHQMIIKLTLWLQWQCMPHHNNYGPTRYGPPDGISRF